MLKYSRASADQDRPGLSEIVGRLSHEGSEWVGTEMRLARAELEDFKSRAIKVLCFGLVAFVLLFCSLFILSQSAVEFLAPIAGGPAPASLIVGLILMAGVAVSLLVTRNALAWRADSIFFRWFARHSNWEGDLP
jgi:hypothetical protein